ncbi:DUF4174 domain-containing protein [Catalinimonas sp. 4WD22]|uniref:DUF4174 domain-containing protein n=1 Tax=Catalinimonas locisalis TaxID=3133978 RepID=UPI003100BD0C
MKIINIYLIITMLSMANPALSQEIQVPGSYHWKNRILLLFSSNQGDMFQQQAEIFDAKRTGMKERDLVLFYIKHDTVEAPDGKKYEKKAAEQLRKQFQVADDAFSVILIGKDGTQKLKQEELLSTDKLFAIIDAMPMRKREMREDDGN